MTNNPIDAIREKIDLSMTTTPPTDWPQPTALVPNYCPRPFPLHCLPEPYRSFAENVCSSVQVSDGIVGPLLLGTIAATVTGRCELRIASGSWTEHHLGLWVAAIAGPGERKSAVLKLLAAPLQEWEREQAELMAPQIRQAAQERDLLDKRIIKLRQTAVNGKTKDERDLAKSEAILAAEELAETEQVVAPRLLVDDVTPEGLRNELAVHRHLTIMSSEGGFFSAPSQYATNGGASLDIFLKSWSGDSYRATRASTGEIIIDNPALAVVIAGQPGLLRDLGNLPGTTGRGFLERLLWAVPQSRVGFRQTRNVPQIPEASMSSYSRSLRELLDREIPDQITLDGDALEVFNDFREQREHDMAPGGPLRPFNEWASKSVGLAARIAAVLSIANQADHVTTSAVRDAVEIIDWFTDHAKVAFGVVGSDVETEVAEMVLRWLVARSKDSEKPPTKRDVQASHRNRFPKADLVDPVLDLLEEHDLIRVVPVERDGPGRKPSPEIEVSPYAEATLHGND